MLHTNAPGTRGHLRGSAATEVARLARCAVGAGALILSLLTPSPLFAQEQEPPTVQLIQEAAHVYGIDPAWLLRLARCESQLGTHWRTNHPSNPHRGVMQFERSTWQELAPQIGVSGHFDEAYSPASNVHVAAYSLAIGQAYRWSCK